MEHFLRKFWWLSLIILAVVAVYSFATHEERAAAVEANITVWQRCDHPNRVVHFAWRHNRAGGLSSIPFSQLADWRLTCPPDGE
jgi:hypothetical protein